METIVVGYDETESSQRALARAAELSSAFGATLVVTSVARLLVSARSLGAVDPVDPPELHREELDHAKAALTERGIEARFELMTGEPATAIVELADRSGADLIVVGTRQLGVVSDILGTSVSGAVRRKARCDVLVVQ